MLSIVTGHRLLLKGVVLDHKKRDVEGTAIRVVGQEVRFPVIFYVQSIGDRCLGQLVDEPQYIHTVDVPSILGCLALQRTPIDTVANATQKAAKHLSSIQDSTATEQGHPEKYTASCNHVKCKREG